MESVTIYFSDEELAALNELKNAIGNRLHPTRAPRERDAVIRWCVAQTAYFLDRERWPAPPTAHEITAAQAEHEVAADTVDLDDLTVKQLRGYADYRRIDLGDATLKADIIAALQAAL